MTFIENFEKIKAAFASSKTTGIEGHLAIQINLNDADASGIMYVEVKDGVLYVEPYDYYDRDAMFILPGSSLIDIVKGKLDYDTAIEEGILAVYGNTERAREFRKLVAKRTRKTAAASGDEIKKTAKKVVKEAEKTARKTCARVAKKADEVAPKVKKAAENAGESAEKLVEAGVGAAKKAAGKAAAKVKELKNDKQ